jgi:dephospho-CoA kinase
MGKSAITKQLNYLGFPVFDADATVHKLYSSDASTIAAVGHLFPTAIVQGAVNRGILSSLVLQTPQALVSLERLVHPRIAEKREQFYEEACLRHDLLVVYDIPLLFEKKMESEVDIIIIATASEATQRSRVLGRQGMSPEKFESILSKQLPDSEKRKLGHYIINTDFEGFSEAKSQLCSILENIISSRPLHFHDWKMNFSAGSTIFLFK